MLILRPLNQPFSSMAPPKAIYPSQFCPHLTLPMMVCLPPMTFARTSIIIYCQDIFLSLEDQPGIFWAWNPISNCPVNVSTYISLDLKLHLSKTKLNCSLAALECISLLVTHLNWYHSVTQNKTLKSVASFTSHPPHSFNHQELLISLSMHPCLLFQIYQGHTGSGPHYFTSTPLHLPHDPVDSNFPALESMSPSLLNQSGQVTNLVKLLWCVPSPIT